MRPSSGHVEASIPTSARRSGCGGMTAGIGGNQMVVGLQSGLWEPGGNGISLGISTQPPPAPRPGITKGRSSSG